MKMKAIDRVMYHADGLAQVAEEAGEYFMEFGWVQFGPTEILLQSPNRGILPQTVRLSLDLGSNHAVGYAGPLAVDHDGSEWDGIVAMASTTGGLHVRTRLNGGTWQQGCPDSSYGRVRELIRWMEQLSADPGLSLHAAMRRAKDSNPDLTIVRVPTSAA